MRYVFSAVRRLSHPASYGEHAPFVSAKRPECDRDSNAVSDLRLGEVRLETEEDGLVELPESMQNVLGIDTLWSTVFDGFQSNYSDVSWLSSRAILFTKNSRLIEINAKFGSRSRGSYKAFLGADSVEDEDQNGLRYPAELLNSLNGG